jgi:peptide/nickel transport system permease protein
VASGAGVVHPVTRWLLRRAAQAGVTLVVVTVLLFFLMRLAPGDPLGQLGDERQYTQAQLAVLRHLYHTDQPLLRQLASWAMALLHGDLGSSFSEHRPVTALIAERLPATLQLGGTVLLVNFTLGLWLGAVQAVRRGGWVDRWLTTLSLAGFAMPSFWLGLMLAWLVGVKWRLVPPGGIANPLLGPDTPWWILATDRLAHLILPAATLVIVSIAITMRYQRRAMLEVLPLPYIVAARAKGLPESVVRRHHAWRNALFPVLTLVGLWLPILVTGSVFVEAVFAWPGLGSLAAEAIGRRDYPLLMGTGMLVSAMVIGGGLLTDVAYALLDPRVRWA